MSFFVGFTAFAFGCNYLKRVPINWKTVRVSGNSSWKTDYGPSVAIASTYFAGVFFVAIVYMRSWRRGDNPTV
jgi:hypothetical protein